MKTPAPFRRIRLGTVATALSLLLVAAGCSGGETGESGETTTGSSEIDADVQAAFDDVVQQEMPDVDIALVQAAKEEGALTVYHSTSDGDSAVIAAFREDFPFITVEEVEDTVSPLLERFASESEAGRHIADVITSTEMSFVDPLIEAGFVAEYVPTSDSSFPDDAKQTGLAYPGAVNAQAVGWNTDVVSDEEAEVLRTWEGLNDPSLRDYQWGLFDATDPAGLTLKAVYAQYQLMGTDFWDAIAPSQPSLYTSGSQAISALVAGEDDIYAQTTVRQFEGERVAGAPIHYVVPEPMIIAPTAQFISANAPNPNAARLYQEWALTPRAGAIWLEHGAFTLLPGVEDPRPIAQESWYIGIEGREVFPIDDEQFEAEWPDVMAAWSESILGP